MSTIKEYVNTLNRTCKEKNLRLTPQRLEVYKTIVKTKEHPSADYILKRVRKKIPNISHDTVYRTLSWLVDNKIVNQVSVVDGVARYDGDLSFHYHYICEVCNSVRDIFPENPSASNFFSPDMPEDFSVKNIMIEIRGICGKCKN